MQVVNCSFGKLDLPQVVSLTSCIFTYTLRQEIFTVWNLHNWDLKSAKLKCHQKYFFSSTTKLKCPQTKFLDQNAKLKWREKTFKVGLSPSKKVASIYLNESPFKMMKNPFYFKLKALFVLEIFKFLSWLLGYRKTVC